MNAPTFDLDDRNDLMALLVAFSADGYRVERKREGTSYAFVWLTPKGNRVRGFYMDDEQAAFKDSIARVFQHQRRF